MYLWVLTELSTHQPLHSHAPRSWVPKRDLMTLPKRLRQSLLGPYSTLNLLIQNPCFCSGAPQNFQHNNLGLVLAHLTHPLITKLSLNYKVLMSNSPRGCFLDMLDDILRSHLMLWTFCVSRCERSSKNQGWSNYYSVAIFFFMSISFLEAENTHGTKSLHPNGYFKTFLPTLWLASDLRMALLT